MATPLRLDGALAKVETAYGTDAAPTAADNGVRVSERLWSSITLEHAFMNRRSSSDGTILPIAPAARTGRIATLEIAWDARGAGSAYSASNLPEADPLFQACGLSQTVVATPGSESVTYAQADTGHKSATIWAYAGNKLIKVVGCRGSVRWPLEAGAFGIFRFRMQGLVTAAPTEVALASITYDAVVPPTAVGATLSVAGIDPDVVSAEFDQGATVVQLPSANAADGIASFEISEVNPTVSLSIKAPPLSGTGLYDYYAGAKASTAVSIDWVLGTAQYNKATFSVTSEAYLEQINHVDQDSFAGLDLTYQLKDFSILWS